MDDREIYWRQTRPTRRSPDSPVFYDPDARPRGPYAGRGPKGYTRSDEWIREEINEELTLSPYVDATEVVVDVRDGIVILTGTVDDRRAKRVASEIAERVKGVHDVQNKLISVDRR